MSSNRDRLIELFHKAEDICDRTLDCDTCKYVLSGSCKTVLIADYLLANGVIVQQQGEWETTQEPLGWKDVECVKCSACHESWICDEENDFEFYKEFWKYCPNCGARIVKGV